MIRIEQVDVNRLAQTFHENSDGLTHAGCHEKPKIISGLTAVFEAMGIEVVGKLAHCCEHDSDAHDASGCLDCACNKAPWSNGFNPTERGHR